jgi:hypothetical protein
MVSSRSKDYVSAVLLVLAGVAAIVGGRSYKVGSLTEMGAGFLPTLIGILLIVVGLLIAATSSPMLAHKPNMPAHKPSGTGTPETLAFDLRAWGFIAAGVASFVLLGTYGGFVPASFACVFISALADRQNSIKHAAILAVVIAAAGYLIFHVGLRLQFDAFTWG